MGSVRDWGGATCYRFLIRSGVNISRAGVACVGRTGQAADNSDVSRRSLRQPGNTNISLYCRPAELFYPISPLG